jgi:dTDP-glucose 4,6-dehydratase
MRILVTGGAGFVGSALVRHLIGHTGHEVLVVDKLTYAANLASLDSVRHHPRYHLSRTDICDHAAITELFTDFGPDAVMHLAAESHVDRSIDAPGKFINTNIIGTYVLLEASLAHWQQQGTRREGFRFLHVSTDEVYGALTGEGHFTEETAYDPRSPYSATKAASDHLVRAWHHTFGLPILVTNCSNNYGPHQFPEKLIPMTIIRGLAAEPMPVYGRGLEVRDWLFVEDHARALTLVVENGRIGQTYAIGGGAERTNIAIVRSICDAMDRLVHFRDGSSHHELISFVPDRPGHDFRYAIDFSKLKTELGWWPECSFDQGLLSTVQWYIKNRAWWEPLLIKHEAIMRRGLNKRA